MQKDLKELVPELVRSLGITEAGYQMLTLIEHEAQKIDPTAQVVASKNGKIFIEAESSVQVFELSLRRKEILKILDCLPEVGKPELFIRLKGTAQPTALDRRRSSGKFRAERN